ncbi:MAG: histidine kinase [Clostridiales bacterium]|nr:histidine kinase [Clostridiales bacterium]
MKFLSRVHRTFIDLPLRTKLVLVFAFTMFMVAFVNIYMHISINSVVGTIDKVYASNVSLNQLMGALDDVQENMFRYLNTKSTAALNDYYLSEQSYSEQITSLNDQPTDNELKLTEKNIRNISGEYLKLTAAAVAAKRGRDVELYRSIYEDASKLYGYLDTYINELNNARFKTNAESYNTLRSSLKYMQTFSTVILFVAITGNMFVLMLLSSTITKPLTKLARQAEQVGKGDFDIDFITVESRDEVGVLADAFNQMTDSLQEHVDQIKTRMAEESRLKETQLRMENSLKESQLIFLQSQINPHFLYNTLNAGAQLAMMEGAEKTTLFIENLADFFRYSVKHTGQTSSLADEISQVETYLHIINVRFSGEIQYVKRIEGLVERITLPGVILQPIVENAINHGLRDVKWGKRIELSALEEEDRILVTIADNGKGMTRKEIEAVLVGQPAAIEMDGQQHRGTGLKNVIERLRIYFGIHDVFEIASDGPGRGTAVTIIIPKRSEHGA